MELRPYQWLMLDRAREEALRGRRRILLVAPTGAGKTVLLAENIRRFLERGRGMALYVVHRRQLVRQTHALLEGAGIEATFLMAGERTDWKRRVLVASRDTLLRRFEETRGLEVGLLIFDEAHIGLSLQMRIAEHLEPRYILGYTATPLSLSGPGMGALYEVLVAGPTYEELIAEGYLVPTRFIASFPREELLSLGVDPKTGDYRPKEVVELAERGKLYGDPLSAYLEHGGKRTVIFAPSVDIAANLAERFGAGGIRAATIDWRTEEALRERLLRDFREGSLPVLCNVDVFSEGWDEPLVDTVMLLSPTRSLARYLQRVGRGMRPAPGKTHLTVIDMVGNYFLHGAPEDVLGWELEPPRPRRSPKEVYRLVRMRPRCPVCGEEMRAKRCLNCGFTPHPRYRPAWFQMVEEVGWEDSWEGPPLREEVERERRRRFYLGLLYYAREKGFRDAWAAHAYREKFKKWPDPRWRREEPIPPVPEVERWIRRTWLLYRIRQAKRYDSLLNPR